MIRGSRRIKRAMLILGTVLLMLAAASAVNVVPSAAQDPPPPIAAEPLTARSVFPDEIDMKFKLKLHDGGTVVVNVDDPSRTVDVRYTVQPGAQFPWHSHRGPVVVNIISGPSPTSLRARATSGRTRQDRRSSTRATVTSTAPSTAGRSRRCSSPPSSRHPRRGRCSSRQTLVAS